MLLVLHPDDDSSLATLRRVVVSLATLWTSEEVVVDAMMSADTGVVKLSQAGRQKLGVVTSVFFGGEGCRTVSRKRGGVWRDPVQLGKVKRLRCEALDGRKGPPREGYLRRGRIRVCANGPIELSREIR